MELGLQPACLLSVTVPHTCVPSAGDTHYLHIPQGRTSACRVCVEIKYVGHMGPCTPRPGPLFTHLYDPSYTPCSLSSVWFGKRPHPERARFPACTGAARLFPSWILAEESQWEAVEARGGRGGDRKGHRKRVAHVPRSGLSHLCARPQGTPRFSSPAFSSLPALPCSPDSPMWPCALAMPGTPGSWLLGNRFPGLPGARGMGGVPPGLLQPPAASAPQTESHCLHPGLALSSPP